MTITLIRPALPFVDFSNGAGLIEVELPPEGPAGISGTSQGVQFTYDTTTTDADPGPGDLRANNANLALATTLYIDNVDRFSRDVSAWLDSLDDSGQSSYRGQLKIAKRNEEEEYALYKVTGSTVDGTGYRKITVVALGPAPTWANGTGLSVSFLAAGVTSLTGVVGTALNLAALKGTALGTYEVAFLYGRLVAGDLASGLFQPNPADLSGTLVRLSLTSTSVNSGTDEITIDATELEDRMQGIVTAAVNGLSLNTLYEVRRLDETKIQLLDPATRAVINLTGTTNITLKILLDPEQGVYVIPTGAARDGSAGAFVRNGTGLRDVEAGWFGLDWAGIQAAIFFKGFLGGGRVLLPSGNITVDDTLNFVHPNVTLEGQGSGQALGDLPAISATRLIFTNDLGPCIRRKADHCHLRSFTVGSDAGRFAALRITADNYVSEAVARNKQNPGVWTEAEDYDDELYATDCHDDDVWVEEQPSDGWVWIAGYFRSGQTGCGVRNVKGHGVVEDSGIYTDRDAAAITAGGIFETHKSSINECQGHTLVTGHPDGNSGSVVRSLWYNLDTYNCGIDPAIMIEPDYVIWRFCDEGQLVDSAISCLADLPLTGKSAIYGAGRVNKFENIRYLHLDAARAPIKWKHSHTPSGGSARTSGGLRVRDGFVQTVAGTGAAGLGICPAIVEMTGQDDGSAIIEKSTIDGSFGTDLVIGGFPLREVRAGTGRSYGLEHFGGGIFFDRNPDVLTIAAGVVALPTVGAGVVLIITNEDPGSTTTDDLDKITGGTIGRWIRVEAVSSGETLVIKHSTSTDGFRLDGGNDITLSGIKKGIWFLHDGSSWVQQTPLLNIL